MGIFNKDEKHEQAENKPIPQVDNSFETITQLTQEVASLKFALSALKQQVVKQYGLLDGHIIPFNHVTDIDSSSKTIYVFGNRAVQEPNIESFNNFRREFLVYLGG